MSRVKSIIIVVLMVGAIIALGKLVPEKIKLSEKISSLFRTDMALDLSLAKKKSYTPVQRTLPAEVEWRKVIVDSLYDKFGITNQRIKPANDTLWNIRLPLGVSMVEYALEINRICKHFNIHILRGTVLRSQSTAIAYKLKNGDEEFLLRLKYRSTVLPGSIKIALVFTQLDGFSQKDFILLANTNWKKTLVINPYSPNQKLLAFVNNLTTDEIYISLPMEPFHYPYQNPGKGSVLIHQSQNEVEKLLNQKLVILPTATGFTSFMGSRAIENRELLERIFRFNSERNLGFIDITGSSRSLSIQIAREFEILCRQTAELKPSRNPVNELITKTAAARRYGEAVLVTQYSRSNLKTLNRYIKGGSLRNKGIKLVTFSELDRY
jgi:polysaccharide deacetylase 2 family uncharacterized protein YibQ